jgi:hypothetical protein
MFVLQGKLELMLMHGEGKNLTEEEMKWMKKPVNWKEILGVKEDSPSKRKGGTACAKSLSQQGSN